MNRNLLVGAALLFAAAGCETGATFTRTCYEVPHTVAETRGDTVVTETGVRYIDNFVGAGAEAATCTNVTVAYTGQLLDGTEFDDGTFAFIPGAAHVVRGLEQGVVGMRVEGVRRIIIPPELGYGDVPKEDLETGEILVPAGSTLVFDIEVLAVQQIGLTQ
jgi:FKBP-type peptidyl-prolyl cis-trans isomerase